MKPNIWNPRSWFGCVHEFSFPLKAPEGFYYQVCIHCGAEYGYDWQRMKRTRPLPARLLGSPTNSGSLGWLRPKGQENTPAAVPAAEAHAPQEAPLAQLMAAIAVEEAQSAAASVPAQPADATAILEIEEAVPAPASVTAPPAAAPRVRLMTRLRALSLAKIGPVPASALAGALLLGMVVMYKAGHPRKPIQLSYEAVTARETPAATAKPAEVAEIAALRVDSAVEAATAPKVAESRPVEPVENEPRVKRAKKTAVVAMAKPAPDAGEAMVTSTPDGAQVRIVGRDAVFVTPAVVGSLAPGRYTVVVSKSGFIPQTLDVEVVAGSRSTLQARLAARGSLIKVASTPTGAAILLDGRDTSLTSPAELRVENNGKHTITLLQGGYLKSESVVQAKDGENVNLAVTLVQAGDASAGKTVGGLRKLIPGGAPKQMADVQFKTNPKGAHLKLNGWSAPKATPFELRLPPGGYEVEIQAEGYRTLSKMIVVEAGQKIVLQESMQPSTP